MEPYKNILAVINHEHYYRNTLLKSMYLSKKSGAKLTLLDIQPNIGLFSTPSTPLSVNSAIDELDDLLVLLKQNDVNFEIRHENVNQDYKRILQVLNHDEFDLVIKEKTPKHHNYLGLKPSGDWHLLRDSSVPVMLVTKNEWSDAGHVLTAIETENQENTHLNINHEILSHTCSLSHLLSSHVHLVNCFLGEDMSIAIDFKPTINQKLLHLQHLVELSEDAGDFATTLHISQGLPENKISELATKYHVNMVVLGTSEHSSLMNNITGHTSEYIIDRLDCDVLTIKSQHTVHH